MNARHRMPRIVFLGCGAACGMHSRTLRGIGGVELCYASSELARADAMRRRYDGRAAYGSYDDALADSFVTVAIVTTPTVLHRELALRALAAGKDVIVEKPAFMNVAELVEVAHAAKAADRRVFVAENYFYKPITHAARRAIRSGMLGDVRFVIVNATKSQPPAGWRADPAVSGGGALFEGGVHWINFMSNIGLDVTGVHAHRASDQDGPDLSTAVVLEYAGGAIGTLFHSWELRAPFGHLRLSRVQGTRGVMHFESNGLAYAILGKRREIGMPVLSDPLGYREMFRDFLHALRTGAPPRFTLQLAMRDLMLLEQAYDRFATAATV
jgi:UDP-N-acetylglucosamine 3-dehydrogenase